MALLLRGALVHGHPGADAIAVAEGRVTWIGTAEESRPHGERGDRVVELPPGSLLLPAFVDAHVHTTMTGLGMRDVDLGKATSAEDALHRLATYARAHDGVILGHGWDHSGWPERRPPTRAQLDAAAPGRQTYLVRVDGHSALVSSALLDRAPEARHKPGFDADGWLTRAAHHAVRRVALASVTAAQRTEAQRATRRHAASLGIAAIHESAGPDISSADDLAALLALGKAEPGPVVLGYWGQTAADGGLDVVRDLGLAGAGGDLFVDGAIGSRTACLHSPYVDGSEGEATHGATYLDTDAIADHLIAATRAGVQAGFHAIGDAALDSLADALERAVDVLGAGAVAAARHRVEHVEMPSARLIRILAQLGVTASVQPMFDALWGGPEGMYVERLGPQRGVSLNPFRRLADAGVALALGSDSPVTELGPWQAVQAAVEHRTPGSGLSVEEAFDGHTAAGWRAARVDGTGDLALGAPAHLAVWTSPLGVDARGLPSLPSGPQEPWPECLVTVVGGDVVHG